MSVVSGQSLEFHVLNNIKLKSNLNSESKIMIYEDFNALIVASALLSIQKGVEGQLVEITTQSNQKRRRESFTQLGIKKLPEEVYQKIILDTVEGKIEDDAIESAFIAAESNENIRICDSAIFATRKIVPDLRILMKIIDKVETGSPIVVFCLYFEVIFG